MLVHRRIDVAAFATASLATVLIASDQGGYFQRTWPWAGLALAAAGALVLRSGFDFRPSRASLVLVASTGAIAAWTALSWLWSVEPSTTGDEALRASIYVAAAILFVALASAGGATGIVLGIAAGATGIAAYSLTHRQFAPAQGRLLAEPLGYANALGALCAIGLVIVVTFGVARRWWLAAAPAAVLLVALALTSSRGSWLALAAGGAVAAAAAKGWAGRAAFVVAAALAALFAVTAFSAPDRLQARGDYWHVAWHVGFHHPLGGTGAGTYDLEWAAFGDLARWGNVLDAHSLYLETFAELGLVGVVLVLALLVPVSAAVRGPLSATSTAAAAGAVTFLVHAGLDWDWEMPAVTLVGIACLAACCRPGSASVKRTQSAFWAIAAGLILIYGLDILIRKG